MTNTVEFLNELTSAVEATGDSKSIILLKRFIDGLTYKTVNDLATTLRSERKGSQELQNKLDRVTCELNEGREVWVVKNYSYLRKGESLPSGEPMYDYVEVSGGFACHRINLETALNCLVDLNTPYRIVKTRKERKLAQSQSQSEPKVDSFNKHSKSGRKFMISPGKHM